MTRKYVTVGAVKIPIIDMFSAGENIHTTVSLTIVQNKTEVRTFEGEEDA